MSILLNPPGIKQQAKPKKIPRAKARVVSGCLEVTLCMSCNWDIWEALLPSPAQYKPEGTGKLNQGVVKVEEVEM